VEPSQHTVTPSQPTPGFVSIKPPAG
jgi:hypothetical protein